MHAEINLNGANECPMEQMVLYGTLLTGGYPKESPTLMLGLVTVETTQQH